MKTDKKTVGFGGGITNARTVRPKRCAAPVVQMRRCENARMAAKKDARPKRQLRTGASNCRPQLTEDSIARMPRWRRLALYAFGALTLSGVLPMAAAALLITLCDLVGWWLLIPLYIVVGRVLWRVIWQ